MISHVMGEKISVFQMLIIILASSDLAYALVRRNFHYFSLCSTACKSDNFGGLRHQ
jgi:hypothetical protein